MPYDENNIFAKILRKEIPCTPVYEDEKVLAFLDIRPINPGHLLIAVKKPAVHLSDLTLAEAAHLMRVAKRLAKAQKKAMKAAGMNLLLNDGPAAGQEVPHLHMHIIPRFKNDGFGLSYGPQGRPQKTPEELLVVAEKIRPLIK